MSTQSPLVRGLGPVATTAIVVGNVIGTGVFLKSRVMTCNVGTPGRVLDHIRRGTLDTSISPGSTSARACTG